MTALAGFWSFSAKEDPARACTRMLQSQSVYAPDPPAVWRSEQIALGRRLFRTLPEDIHDQRPIVAADGEQALVADLRLDNREELCDSLGIASSEARLLSDAALLMRALTRWEEEAVQRLSGDFAFVWWNGRRRRLLLARDFMGQRPLHYHRSRGFFAFASMAKGLHALPQVSQRPNLDAVAAFLALVPETGSESFYEDVEKVRPGHVLTVSFDKIVERRFWEPTPEPLRFRRHEEYEEGLREQLDRAVAVRLRGAAGSVAAHLSAGLDSSAVAATAARLLVPQRGSVTAYTAVPREGFATHHPSSSILDEGPLAAAVAALHPNIEHVRIRSGTSPTAGLNRAFFLHERPVLNLINGVWWNAILDDAKARRIGVLLTGQMGNMSLSYDGMAFLPELLRKGRLWRLSRLVFQLLRNGARVGTVGAQTVAPFLPVPLWNAVNRLRGKGQLLTQYSALNPSLASDEALHKLAAARGLDVSYRPRSDPRELRLWVLRRVDFGNYNKGFLGGWGIDVRDPTADKSLIEFCLSIPPDQFLAGGIPRSLARRALSDRLPAQVLRERRKGYQAADWHEGLTAAREELRAEVERLGSLPEAAQVLDVGGMAQLIEEWPSDGWESDLVVARYRLALLRGTSAGHFIRRAMGANG